MRNLSSLLLIFLCSCSVTHQLVKKIDSTVVSQTDQDLFSKIFTAENLNFEVEFKDSSKKIVSNSTDIIEQLLTIANSGEVKKLNVSINKSKNETNKNTTTENKKIETTLKSTDNNSKKLQIPIVIPIKTIVFIVLLLISFFIIVKKKNGKF